MCLIIQAWRCCHHLPHYSHMANVACHTWKPCWLTCCWWHNFLAANSAARDIDMSQWHVMCVMNVDRLKWQVAAWCIAHMVYSMFSCHSDMSKYGCCLATVDMPRFDKCWHVTETCHRTMLMQDTNMSRCYGCWKVTLQVTGVVGVPVALEDVVELLTQVPLRWVLWLLHHKANTGCADEVVTWPVGCPCAHQAHAYQTSFNTQGWGRLRIFTPPTC